MKQIAVLIQKPKKNQTDGWDISFQREATQRDTTDGKKENIGTCPCAKSRSAGLKKSET